VAAARRREGDEIRGRLQCWDWGED